MTPKEKAKELANKYKPFVYCYSGSGMLSNQEDEGVILNNSKLCALIAVDEMIDFEKRIINQLHKITKNAGGEFKVENEFWIQVKEEIEKL